MSSPHIPARKCPSFMYWICLYEHVFPYVPSLFNCFIINLLCIEDAKQVPHQVIAACRSLCHITPSPNINAPTQTHWNSISYFLIIFPRISDVLHLTVCTATPHPPPPNEIVCEQILTPASLPVVLFFVSSVTGIQKYLKPSLLQSILQLWVCWRTQQRTWICNSCGPYIPFRHSLQAFIFMEEKDNIEHVCFTYDDYSWSIQ